MTFSGSTKADSCSLSAACSVLKQLLSSLSLSLSVGVILTLALFLGRVALCGAMLPLSLFPLYFSWTFSLSPEVFLQPTLRPTVSSRHSALCLYFLSRSPTRSPRFPKALKIVRQCAKSVLRKTSWKHDASVH